ncbi:3-phosphoshikimate 1-carboxyvinyltransferase [Luteitalea sp. TBR-22]|uniref:3-phosphoshikimate 1-carboxyvinyltransferase n=1 Tax=Luteitalea sp. TBR-22 TaxID=2802971 RepID=UPI001AF2C9BF|nr:3-phosphoshikimate 1-carboxyvinyltransferase [Luteitalea sp. TBR-22]BCS33262.1 3-phosphoshikimate 1-carboxyvinyltransferase [Luteitalea sp. TBR-22]
MSAEFTRTVTVRPATALEGVVRVPGDTSISHRYAMLAALAEGVTRISRFAPAHDCQSTLRCLEQLGTVVSRHASFDRESGAEVPTVQIVGRGLRGLQSPSGDLDCGNSGSTLRMLAGILAAHPFTSVLTGDASLRRRPMMPVVTPLQQMGAEVTSFNGRPPVSVTGGRLAPITYRPDTASAQVKTAVLLAGLQTPGTTTVEEPARTRDHTERALRAFGATLDVRGNAIAISGEQALEGRALAVPGDPSSAAFWACAAAALPGSFVELRDVGLNPSRTAVFDVLRRVGADVDVQVDRTDAEEPVGRVRVRHRGLRGIELTAADVPGLIDELPVLAALATHGGELRVTGAGELRARESDRITALVNGLRALGADADELPDGFHVRGSRRLLGGQVDADDHRLAMAFAVAGLGAMEPTIIRGADAVTVSYPGFFDVLAALRR